MWKYDETNVADEDYQVIDPNLFLGEFNNLMQTCPSFRNTLAVCLLEGIVAHFMGQKNATIGARVLNFYHLLESKSRTALGVVSTNFYGPSL